MKEKTHRKKVRRLISSFIITVIKDDYTKDINQVMGLYSYLHHKDKLITIILLTRTVVEERMGRGRKRKYISFLIVHNMELLTTIKIRR